MIETSLADDTRARITAGSVLDRNFVVSAGAGTGKTSLLVERILAVIGEGRATIGEVAAITFTEKAAGELRERVVAGLDQLFEAASGGRAPEEGSAAGRALERLRHETTAEKIAARARSGLEAVDDAAIGTMHAFCADLLRAFPVEAGVPPNFQVDVGELTGNLFEPAWAHFLADEFGPGALRPAVWDKVLETSTLDDLELLARTAVAWDIPEEFLRKADALDLSAALGGEARSLATDIRSWLGRTPGKLGKPGERLLGQAAALEALAAGETGIVRQRLASEPKLGEPPVLASSLGKAIVHEGKELGGRAASILKAVASVDDDRAALVLQLVGDIAIRVRERARRHGIVDFHALLVLARDLLRSCRRAREWGKQRFRFILIDEFQDTDPIQYEVVLFLAEGQGEFAPDPFSAHLAPGRLFVVGDAKQSIYRFRGADYGAYRRAVDCIKSQGGEELTLARNFRSVPHVVAAVNSLFDPSRWSPSEYQPAYARIEATRGAPPGRTPVELWSVDAGLQANALERRRAEARAIADGILRHVRDHGGRFGDALVLLRAFPDVAEYLRALRDADIPFIVTGGTNFRDRIEVRRAIALLRVISQPTDATALLAYLRSPVGGVADAELARHRRLCGTWRPDAPVDRVECPGLFDALARLQILIAECRALPADRAVRRAIEHSASAPLEALGFEGAQRVANLEKLAAQATVLARDGRLSFQQVVDALQSGPRLEDESDSPLADEAADVVRVSTIHKAKGLEAPLVFVADLGRESRDPSRLDQPVTAVDIRGRSGLAIQTKHVRNGWAVAAVREEFFHEEAQRHRLLYVALTRARDRLVLVATGDRSKAPWLEALTAWGYDAESPPADGFELAEGAVLHRAIASPARSLDRELRDSPSHASEVTRYRAARDRATAVAAPHFRPPSLYEFRPLDSPGAIRGELAPSLARAVGTVVHARLERYAGNSAALPTALEDDAVVPSIENDVDATAVAREARLVLEAFAASPLAARLGGLDLVGREVPLLLDEGARGRWRGTIDLLYREPNGTLVVADYKTDADLGGALDRHREQLRVYVEAVRRAIPGARVRSELWMLRHGAIVRG